MSIIIGIDHGYYAIKTAHCSFPAGLTSYGEHEPYTRQGLLEFGGCFFVCGSGRQPIQRDKTANDNYYLLTLAAIAKEIRQRGLPPECSVRIAAGLPLTSFGRDKPKFREYLLRSKQPLNYKFEGVEYSITIEEVAVFPQGYAALMTEVGLLQDEPSMLLMDLGGWTVDLMRIDNAIPAADTAHSLELGMIRCVDNIREQARRETGLSLTDAQIENMLAGQPSFFVIESVIRFIDMFSGIGGFREGLTRAGGFTCVGHCEIDKYANRSYNALFDTKGEWFIEDARKADPSAMPDFQLLCGGFPCQTFSIAGTRKGFGDPRGTLFFELARLAEARKPPYLLFENVPGLLSHDGGRTFATILNALDRLGYGVEWQCLNSKDFGVPQSRNRVYIVGYLDERCRGKVFPFTETAGSSLIQTHGGHQGERVYSPEGLSCTLAANPGGFGGKTGLYEMGVPIKCATKTGYQLAQVGDSIDLSYATVNSRRGRVGKEIAHTLTTGCQQGTVDVCPVKNPIKSDPARNAARTGKPGAPMHTLTTKDRHGVLCEGRIRRLTPRECLRLQGWTDDRIDTVLTIQSDNQAYKQAGNGVTVNVIEAIGWRIAAMDAELRGETPAP